MLKVPEKTTDLKNLSWLALPTLACSLLLAMAVSPAGAQMGAQPAPGAVIEASDNVSTLNNEFRDIYKKARERCTADTLPLIICYSDRMILLDKDRRQEFSFIPEKYTRLKVVDHVPLALFVLLDAQSDKILSADTIEQLNRIKKLVLTVRPDFALMGLDSETLARQYKLLDRSVSFIDDIIKDKSVSKKALTSFCRTLEPMIMKNADQAVASQLAIMDKNVSLWRDQLGSEQFKKIHVIIVSGHMPRDRHTCFQYFAKALKVKKEGLQIVYSEGEAEEKPARELVGTHVLDASIGEAFFNEQLRMHRDLLSDGAARYLSSHPPLKQKAQ